MLKSIINLWLGWNSVWEREHSGQISFSPYLLLSGPGLSLALANNGLVSRQPIQVENLEAKQCIWAQSCLKLLLFSNLKIWLCHSVGCKMELRRRNSRSTKSGGQKRQWEASRFRKNISKGILGSEQWHYLPSFPSGASHCSRSPLPHDWFYSQLQSATSFSRNVYSLK